MRQDSKIIKSKLTKGWMLSLAFCLLLASCASGNEEAVTVTPEEKPTVQPSVPHKTNTMQLGLSVGTSTRSMTRQTTVVTQAQADPLFRGMQNIYLIPIKTNESGAITEVYPRVDLPASNSNIPATDTSNSIKSLNSESSSQLYSISSLEQGINGFLFYGKATDATEEGASEQRLQQINGALTASINATNPTSSTFAPVPYYNNSGAPEEATAMRDYLTDLLNSDVDGNYWSQQDDDSSLKTLHKKMNGLNVGCSKNILAALENLYNKLRSLLLLPDLTDVQSALISKIITNMKIAEEGSASTSDVLSYTTTSSNHYTLAWNASYAGTKFFNYPEQYGFPDGACAIRWAWQNEATKTTGAFSVITDGSLDNTGQHKKNYGTRLDHYVYPAPLYYYVKTPISTSESSWETSYHDNSSTWTTVLGHYNDNKVTEGTASIALTSPVRYAVCRLDVAVKGQGEAAEFRDFAGRAIGMDKLELTGILVTLQHPTNYAFEPKELDNVTDHYTIYDRVIEKDLESHAITLATNYGKSNVTDYVFTHTLVLPTVSREDVDVFFEFQNNSGADITVNDGNLVPPGCKLYMTGRITAGEGTVFEKAKVAVITALVTSLDNAWNTIPPRETGQSILLQIGLQDWYDEGDIDNKVYNW